MSALCQSDNDKHSLKALCLTHAQGWVTEMAAYVKSLDPNHLLTVGEEGFYTSTTNQTYCNPSSSARKRPAKAACHITSCAFCTCLSWQWTIVLCAVHSGTAREKKRKDYTCQHRFNETPGIIPGCWHSKTCGHAQHASCSSGLVPFLGTGIHLAACS